MTGITVQPLNGPCPVPLNFARTVHNLPCPPSVSSAPVVLSPSRDTGLGMSQPCNGTALLGDIICVLLQGQVYFQYQHYGKDRVQRL